MEHLGQIAVALLIVIAGWLGWVTGRAKDEPKRPGYIERSPNASRRGTWRVELHNVRADAGDRQLRRAYFGFRRYWRMTGHGWLPRRPRL